MGYYVDIDFCNLRLTRNVQWNALSNEEKDKWIIMAEYMIDNLELSNNYIGDITDANQDHAFPRDVTTEVSTITSYNPNRSYYNIWWNISDALQTKMENITGDPKPRVVKEAIALIIDDMIDTDKFRTLVAMQNSGIESFSSGSDSFDFDRDGWNKPLTPKSYKMMYYLLRYWWDHSAPPIVDRL